MGGRHTTSFDSVGSRRRSKRTERSICSRMEKLGTSREKGEWEIAVDQYRRSVVPVVRKLERYFLGKETRTITAKNTKNEYG